MTPHSPGCNFENTTIEESKTVKEPRLKRFAADFHIHSRFSRATSKKLTIELLRDWAAMKGLAVLGTGDFTHPVWFEELRNLLEPAEQGLFRVRSGSDFGDTVPRSCRREVRFVLTTEISSIYKRAGRVRKVHNVVFVPGFDEAARLIGRLDRIGNLASDGRPILGLDSELLLEIVLECGDGACLIPAHIWTPWFSALGSKSGFDSIEECYGDLAGEVFSVETGLSSDPEMNRRVESLDRFTLISCSDAHSAVKLGREATLFETEMSYDAIFDALRGGRDNGYRGTVEFYPEEGKYHYDGHRKCDSRLTPEETKAADGNCPVCGKPVTVGVMNRVMELAGRTSGARSPAMVEYHSNIPLHEVLSEILGVGPGSKKVAAEYFKLLDIFGPELDILMTTTPEQIDEAGFPKLAEALYRMRSGNVLIEAGYDGEFGKITVFQKNEGRDDTDQGSLFGEEAAGTPVELERSGQGRLIDKAAAAGAEDADSNMDAVIDRDVAATGGDAVSIREELTDRDAATDEEVTDSSPVELPDNGVLSGDEDANSMEDKIPAAGSGALKGLDSAQEPAARLTEGALIIEAGPGAGKTRTLVSRIRHMVEDLGIPPEGILAVAFTNRAAGELKERLGPLLCRGEDGGVTVKTFHSLCLGILKEELGDIRVLDRSEAESLIEEIRQDDPEWKKIRPRNLYNAISLLFRKGLTGGVPSGDSDPVAEIVSGDEKSTPGRDESADIDGADGDTEIPRLIELFDRYVIKLEENRTTDFDYIVYRAGRLLAGSPSLRRSLRERYPYISVDEFQDVDMAQYDFLTHLAGPGNPNLCVIGDPGQSIYGFRGADPRFMTQFVTDYPETVTVTLARNYRSTGRLVEAARQVTSAALDTTITSPGILPAPGAEPGPEIRMARFQTAGAEAEFVSSTIERLTGGISHFSIDSGRVDEESDRIGFSDIAVLYRTALVASPVVTSLKKLGIPFQTTGETLVTETPHGRRIIGLLKRLASGKTGTAVATQVLEMGIIPGETSVREMVLAAARTLNAGKTGETAGKQDTAIERAGILAGLAAPFGADLDAFIDFSETLRPEDMFDPRAEKVSLLTIHSSKGLEFPVVFIIGCEEGILPFFTDNEPSHLAAAVEDEERRLFFVGMTRAERLLFLSSAEKRMLFGKTRRNPRSRYLDVIDAALTKQTGLKEKKRPSGPVQGSLF